MNKVLLIGNGVNNIESNYTWSDLISNLINYIGAKGKISTKNKPFPLLYEEIFVEAIKNKRLEENAIKDFIAKQVLELKPNVIHREILNVGINNILTTNYDFTFEKLLTNDFTALKNNGIVKETIYNVFRHYKFNDYVFWHIHGDANSPLAITLGYEHYSGYLQQMRNYVASGTGTSYKIKFDSIIRRYKKRNSMPVHSWLDFFFKDNIYIIGLTLDFIEIHLWWLLTYRQRIALKKKLSLNNKIFYFFPSRLASQIENKIQLLTNAGVIPYSVEDNSGPEQYYKDVLKIVRTH